MSKEPIISVKWQGRDTVAAMQRLVRRAERIEITFPADYNHALFRILNPDAPDAALEEIDVTGGPELLDRMAGIDGLAELARITTRLRRHSASLRLVSPPRLIISLPAATDSQA